MSAADKQLINLSNETTSLTSPKGMVDFASTLKEVIVAQGLYTNIKGKNYVHVEAWQFAGAAMGVIAIVKSTERILTNNTSEVNYRAEVELRRLENDQLVGSGIAFCSNKEYSKKQFDEYAIASMAQTRATSKAYRIAFGWLMKMAGYEATPHEEMDGIGEKDDTPTSRNVVAENAKYMNMKPSDTAKEFPELEREYLESDEPAPATKLQIQRVKSMMKGLGYPDSKITEGLMKIETSEDAERAIESMKLKGGK